MKKEEYALLMLDNEEEKGHFVLAKSIGFISSEDNDFENLYTIYQDIITENIIYPSNYDANEFLNSDEYEKQLKEIKWISRKPISEKSIKKILENMSQSDFIKYGSIINRSRQKKYNTYEKELQKHRKVLKKLQHKKGD